MSLESDPDNNQLTLNEAITKRCRLWNNCHYHNCKGCEGYHNPAKHERIDIEP